MSSKAAREDTRTTNRRLVLQQLFNGGVLSRADLARVTGLTAATVSTLVNELASEDLIDEADPLEDPSRVGKPPTLLRLRSHARSVVAIDLSDPTRLHAGVVDLGGNVTSRFDTSLDGISGDAAVALVLSTARRATEQASSPILGIGIGTPGVVTADGVVVEATGFDWHDVELQRVTEEASDLPTCVANDANAAAVAEFSRGGHDTSHLAVIRIGSGVGAGLILNGRPFEGQHAGAGEIGHLVVDRAGPLCRCGHRGCLETFLSEPHLHAALNAPGASREGVIAAAAERLGVALASLVSILDLGDIIVSGPRELLGETFCSQATASLQQRCLQSISGAVDVRYSELGGDGVLLGAAALVLSKELGVA